MHQLQIHCCTSFEEVIEKGDAIEKSHCQGYDQNFQQKSKHTLWQKKTWAQNKNITNDGVVDAKAFRASPVITLQAPPTTNNQPHVQQQQQPQPQPQPQQEAANAIQNNQRRPPLRNNTPWRNYTPLTEPIESILKLLQNNLIQLPEIKQYDPAFKPPSWNDNDFCDYNRIKAHKTSNCYNLKNIIQDFIDRGNIVVDQPSGSSNTDHIIFTNPLQNHGSRKASSSGTKPHDSVNYNNIAYDYTVNSIRAYDNNVSMITIKAHPKCISPPTKPR